MANFEPALAHVAQHEGGFVNDPLDAGGRTVFGISEKAFPKLYLWTLLNEDKTREDVLKKYRTLNDLVHETNRIIWMDLVEVDVRGTYHDDFWLPLRADEIGSQEIATYLFDFAVNSGQGDAVKALQRALGFKGEAVDGVVGPETLAAVNGLKYGHACMRNLRIERIIHYIKEIVRKPSNMKFARGWIERALS